MLGVGPVRLTAFIDTSATRRVSFWGCSAPRNARSIVPNDRSAVNLLVETPVWEFARTLIDCLRYPGFAGVDRIEVIFRRPTTMLPDHDNQSSAAAAAPTADSEPTQNSTPEEVNPAEASAPEPVAHASEAGPESHDPSAVSAEAPQEHAKAAEAPAAAEGPGATAAPPPDAEATAAAEEAAGSEEMSKLMEQYDEQHEAASQNEIIEVRVVAYTEHGVVVDLGGKTEGLIPAAEFSETDIPRPEPNSTIEVQRTGEHKDGFTILSYQKVLRRRTWEKIEAAYKAKETITGKVVDRIKGGLVVDIGVRAFLPGSQFDLRPTQNLDDLTGTDVQVRVTKLNRRRGNVVVSRRAILEEELHAKRAQLMETLTEGQVVHGHVKNVTEYGAFVDLGGIDGLL